jgi:GNAT superfamily N-acetyltransferase
MPPSADVVIRRAEVADARATADLHIDCWDDAYTGLVPQHFLDDRRAIHEERVEHWARILEAGSATLVAEADGGLVGFSSTGPPRDADLATDFDVELYALYVRARWWGTGVGYALLQAAVGDRATYLWVLDNNPRAIGFYERQGFRMDGTREERDMGVHARMVRAGT